MIIDTHVHIGINEINGELFSGDAAVSRMNKYGIDKSIVFSTRIKDISLLEKQNDYVLDECAKYSGLLFPYFFFVPCAKAIEYLNSTRQSWLGIKLYPNRAGYFMSPYTLEVIQLAKEYHLPLIIHTDTRDGVMDEMTDTLRLSDARNMPVVFCHSFHLSKKHILVAANNSNWYLDSSPWIALMRFSEKCLVPSEQRISFYENNYILSFETLFNLMEGRLLWGTDLYDDRIQSYGAEVQFYHSLPEQYKTRIERNSMLFLQKK